MAYTKIHAVKATVHKAIAYICNPEKTNENLLISSFGCSPETAHFDFKFALSKASRSDENKAYHLIQSFLPGEVDFDTAHQIGAELADRILEGKYSYVVSTHIDREHIHNHIIFCAADNLNHYKYNDCKKSYYNIRSVSDDLCREHNLSVIIPGEKRGKTYKEWQTGKSGTSWKEQLKADIDKAIDATATYDDCIDLIRAKGYEVKGEDFGETAHKYISFRPLNKERFIRGNAKSLGMDYTKERIKERIEEKEHSKDVKHMPFPAPQKPVIKEYAGKNLIDTTEDKFAQSPGLKHWADIQNLKIAAASYSQAGSIAEFEKQIAAKSALVKTARRNLVETDRQLKDLGQILKYADQYKTNRIFHIRYQKSKDKDRYLRQHETELLLHDGAENMLKRLGIDIKKMDIEKLLNDYNALYSQKLELQQIYKSASEETAALNRKLDNLNQYFSKYSERQINKKTDKTTHLL